MIIKFKLTNTITVAKLKQDIITAQNNNSSSNSYYKCRLFYNGKELKDTIEIDSSYEGENFQAVLRGCKIKKEQISANQSREEPPLKKSRR